MIDIFLIANISLLTYITRKYAVQSLFAALKIESYLESTWCVGKVNTDCTISIDSGQYQPYIWGALTYCKCFSHVTKTRPNFTTYTRKPGNNNGTFIFDIDIIKKSYPVNLKFTSLPLSKPKWQFFSGAVSWCSQ